MRALILLSAILIFPLSASGDVSFEGSYDYYLQPSRSNNFRDAEGASLKLSHDIIENLDGRASLSYIDSIDFPAVDDPSGSFGTLRGVGAGYGLVYDIPITKNWSVFAAGELGMFLWEFDRGEFLKSNNVDVDIDPSVYTKIGGGTSIKLSDSWAFSFEIGWFASDTRKECHDDTQTWNILDSDSTLSLQYTYMSGQLKVRF